MFTLIVAVVAAEVLTSVVVCTSDCPLIVTDVVTSTLETQDIWHTMCPMLNFVSPYFLILM